MNEKMLGLSDTMLEAHLRTILTAAALRSSMRMGLRQMLALQLDDMDAEDDRKNQSADLIVFSYDRI